jgi:hypothetical protein
VLSAINIFAYVNEIKKSSAVKKRKNENIKKYNFAYNFYGFKTWSLTLREERALRYFRTEC